MNHSFSPLIFLGDVQKLHFYKYLSAYYLETFSWNVVGGFGREESLLQPNYCGLAGECWQDFA